MRLAAIRKDVFSKFVGEMVSRFVFLLFFFYVGRRLNVADFGTLNLAISVTYILGVVLLDPGLNISTIQLLVDDRENAPRTAGVVFSYKILLFVPLLLVLAGATLLLHTRLPSFYVLALAAFYALFTALLEYLSSVTNAYHRMDVEAVLKILNRVSIVAFGLVGLSFRSVPAVLWAMLLATGWCCLLAWVLVKRCCLPVRFRWDPMTMKRVLLAGLPVAGTLIVTTIYLKWDLLVLSSFHIGREQLGWYAAAFKIVEALWAIPGILGAALFPTMVLLHRQDPANLDRLLRMTTKAVVLVSIPVAATVNALSRPLIGLIYGPEYLPGAAVLAVLIWCIVPMFLYFYLTFVNVAAGKATYNLLAGCVALLAGLVTNFILVPRMGYIGAAWAALIANTSFAVLATWKVCGLFRQARIPRLLLKLGCAGVAMILLLWLGPAVVAVRVVIGLLGYVAVTVGLGSITAEDVAVAVRMLQPNAVAGSVRS